MTVVIQYIGHAIHAGGHITYRRITLDLTSEQADALTLHCNEEEYGPVIFDDDEKGE
ncbi:MAG: hypothetical protein JRN15_15070 [Nitrososphaerota archaeon]|nr:hypothetical protein [Nitrososphaerota archaeon]